MSLDPAERANAFATLRVVVTELNKGDYVPSAAGVKNALLQNDPHFSERAYGFRKFLDFLEAAADAGEVAVLRDPNNHPRIYPVDRPVERVQASIKEPAGLTHGARKLKSDVWRAFVNWGPRDYWRFWDRREGRVFMAPIGTGLDAPWKSDSARFAEIDRVRQELQIEWMRDFAQARPISEREVLLTSVAPDAPVGEYSRALRRLHLDGEWTRELQVRVARHVESWATRNNVGFSRLLEARKPDDKTVKVDDVRPRAEANIAGSDELRRAVHLAVDRMSTDELEKLLIPARFLTA